MKDSTFTKVFAGLSLGLLLATAAQSRGESLIYTMDNATETNHVLIFQASNGKISAVGSLATGGAGTGAGLSSQGSIQLSANGQWLFVCNAGSDEISVFENGHNGLELADKVSSEGEMPVSLALRGDLLYVLNAGGTVGGTDNIAAFGFAGGKLSALAGSSNSLSGTNTTPTDIAFVQGGKVLVVTEKATSMIDTYTVGADGLTTSHQKFLSEGDAPFGFAVGASDRIYVSEAAGVPNASSASSYYVSPKGGLTVISPTNSTRQQAACWLALTPDGQFAYTANAGSGTLSAFSVSAKGDLSLLDFNGITGTIGVGSHPVDMAFSENEGLLFALANGNGTLNSFQISCDGALVYLDALDGIATSSAGLAVH